MKNTPVKILTGKILTGLLLALLISACGEKETADAGEVTREREVLISMQKVEVRDLPIWLVTVGQVHAYSAPTLAAEVEGRITMVAADTGDDIVEGQLLAETDTGLIVLKSSLPET